MGPSRSLRLMRPRIFSQNQSPFFAVSDQQASTNQDAGRRIKRPIRWPHAILTLIRSPPLLTIVLCLQPVSISEKHVKEISCTLRSEPPPNHQEGLFDLFSDCKQPTDHILLPKTFLVCLQMQIVLPLPCSDER